MEAMEAAKTMLAAVGRITPARLERPAQPPRQPALRPRRRRRAAPQSLDWLKSYRCCDVNRIFVQISGGRSSAELLRRELGWPRPLDCSIGNIPADVLGAATTPALSRHVSGGP